MTSPKWEGLTARNSRVKTVAHAVSVEQNVRGEDYDFEKAGGYSACGFQPAQGWKVLGGPVPISCARCLRLIKKTK